MFSVLPDLTPRDCHSLWYVSSRKPNHLPPYLDPAANQPPEGANNPGNNQNAFGNASGPNGVPVRSRSAQAAVIERSAMGRLRADEAYAERRRHNVGNMGSTWLKPPGISKTLFQLREERREAEEHAEALRRERVAQELADAEAEGAAGVGEDGMGMLPPPPPGMEDLDGDMMMDEDGGTGVRDLDDEIPDADEGGFGYDGASDDDEEEEEDDYDDEDEDEADGNDGAPGPQGGREQRRELASQLATARATEDRLRQMMARGQGDFDGDARELYLEEDDLNAEDQANMLEEEDLNGPGHGIEPGFDMNMDADLDADIPEAGGGFYEHTDSDASLSSDEGGPSAGYHGRGPQAARYRSSLARSDVTRNSLDISGILSRDESSILDSSPHVRR